MTMKIKEIESHTNNNIIIYVCIISLKYNSKNVKINEKEFIVYTKRKFY